MKNYLVSALVIVASLSCGDSPEGQFGPYTVSPTSGLTTKELGSSSSFTVVLREKPVGVVTLALTSTDTEEGTVSPATLTFDESNYQTAQTVTVTGADDAVVDGSQEFKVNLNATSSSSSDEKFTVAADVQTVTNEDDLIEDTVLVSFNSGNTASGNAASYAGSIRPLSISANGQFIAFESTATNLVSGDTGGHTDIFLRNIVTAATTRVSVNGSNDGGNGASTAPSVSADGRFVVFQSLATNFVTDANGVSDIYLRDTQAGTTTLVSVNTAGDIGDAASTEATISADGTKVAFLSTATNLAHNNITTTAARRHVYVRDLTAGSTTLVSVDSAGTAQAADHSNDPAISADGKFVAFASFADDIVPATATGAQQVFRRDLVNNSTAHVSISTTGTAGNAASYRPSISSDGSFIAFTCEAWNLVTGDSNARNDICLRNVTNGTTSLISTVSGATTVSGNLGNGNSGNSGGASVSADGRYVIFSSSASNLLTGGADTNNKDDIFSRDTTTGITTRVSLNTDSGQGTDNSGYPACSSDGRVVAYISAAANLVSEDSNTNNDVFASLRL